MDPDKAAKHIPPQRYLQLADNGATIAFNPIAPERGSHITVRASAEPVKYAPNACDQRKHVQNLLPSQNPGFGTLPLPYTQKQALTSTNAPLSG